ncbi:hypothetical protein [Streptomyces inhibens]|uniref:hypothetical protein n=1 Tax=Streptomyces inhibens TaxID=2293571 RepID=UPI001EE70C1F|nr:hypothetical protein [Streptomyces inhibens]UKY49357.1 hypothetical protein KI385_11455 [Streptomyces inhibens]
MDEPTSGPEPEAPTGAVPGEPAQPGEAVHLGEPVHLGAREDSAAVGTVPTAADGPQPLGVGVTPTGEAAVDAGLRRLADADHLPASGHLRVYEDVHRGLRDVLAGLDQHPGPPAPSSTTYDNRS